jgi:hypothetical protein
MQSSNHDFFCAGFVVVEAFGKLSLDKPTAFGKIAISFLN